MPVPAAEPSAALKLLRFAVRALRVSASTLAVIALLRQQWLAGALCSLAWLLILGLPRLIPVLAPELSHADEGALPGSGS